MKLLTFTKKNSGEYSLGVLINDKVLDLPVASQGKIPSDMLVFIEAGEKSLNLAKECISIQSPSALILLNEITVKAPILKPPSLKDSFAFEDHAKSGAKRRGEEIPKEWYEMPAYYKGNHRAILGPDDEILWPSYTRKLDFECEVACVIGKKGKNITEEEAVNYIFGYTIFNDISARDIQKKEMRLRMGPTKSKDFANVFGPYLVTRDEINPSKDLLMKVKVNGNVWSEGHFKDQYWGFPAIVSYISQEETLYPGDILGSGTFFGGCGLDLEKWIQPGDTIELEVSNLGILRNKVASQTEYKELSLKKNFSSLNI